jgi:hypothetical protein
MLGSPAAQLDYQTADDLDLALCGASPSLTAPASRNGVTPATPTSRAIANAPETP